MRGAANGVSAYICGGFSEDLEIKKNCYGSNDKYNY